jgi:serine/threonine protein kinase
MSTSIADFWKLLEKSRLVGAEHCAALAQQFGQIKGVNQQGNAQTLAEWLVTQQAISRYQAKVLLSGKSGPFFYGGFVLFDRISEGPLKSCFRALHPASRHTVALSFFDAEARPEEWEAAGRTLQTAAAWLGHPHLQDIYQLQEQNKKRCTVIGDQQGISLDKVLAKQQRLPAHEACRIVREMLLGLNVIHQTGAVHGAIRPVNIILAPGTNQAVLLQPPIARPFWPIPGTVDLSPYTSAQLMAQVDYMAPELAHAGIPASPVSDIYATGCLLYQLLSGRPPFPGGEVAAKFMRHASEPIHPLEPLGVPPQLAQVVMYMMAKDPSIRYQSAAQLIEALTHFVDPQALQVMPQVPGSLAPFLGWLQTQPKLPESLQAASQQSHEPSFAGASAFGSPNFGGPAEATSSFEMQGSAPAANLFGSTTGQPRAASSPQLIAERIAAKKRKSQQQLLIAAGSIAALMLIAFIVYKVTSGGEEVATKDPEKPAVHQPAQTKTSVVTPVPGKTPEQTATAVNPTPTSPPKAAEPEKASTIVDDGKALWASPTNGQPLSFLELPPSSQFFMSMRPWDFLNKNRIFLKVLAAAGPAVELGRAKAEADLGLNFSDINLLQVAWVAPENSLIPVYYVRLKNREAFDKWQTSFGSAQAVMVGDKSVKQGPKLMYYWPPEDNNMRLIAAYPAQMQEMLTNPGRPHPKVERILKKTDDQRLFNLILTTNFLFQNGASAMPGQEAAIKMFEKVLSYDTEALSLSLHLDDQNFFTELRMLAAPGQSATEAASLFKGKLRTWEPDANDFVSTVLQKNNQEYGYKFLFALPKKIGKFVQMTRADEDEGMVTVRTYLNASAAEHLVQGVELALAYSGTGAAAPLLAAGAQPAAGTPGTPVAAAQPTGNTPADKLKKVVSLTFDRDTLEKSMVMLGEELGMPIEIIGTDLQLEGITKNQSFGLDEKNKTGSEILQVIMKKANIDGKLVYIIKPKSPGGEDMLFITTRSAVAKRKDTLPPELVIDAKPPAKK